VTSTYWPDRKWEKRRR